MAGEVRKSKAESLGSPAMTYTEHPCDHISKAPATESDQPDTLTIPLVAI